MVELKDLQRPELREINLSVRTFPSYSKWLKEKKISPSRLFNKTVEELMGKEEGKVDEKETHVEGVSGLTDL